MPYRDTFDPARCRVAAPPPSGLPGASAAGSVAAGLEAPAAWMPRAAQVGRAGLRLALVGGVLAVLLSGCVGAPGASAPGRPAPDPRWDLFVADDGGDPFAPRVRLWQASERLEAAKLRLRALEGRPPLPMETDLAEAHRQFHAQARLRLARDTLAWVQAQSRRGYRRDPGGDSWPILDELLATGEDDCDGWELLAFTTLRGLGFGPGELFRAVLRSREGEGYHMVTLWLPEGRANGPGRDDPWVLDPTGSVSRGLIRLSRLDGWAPVRLFDEREQFRAVPVSVP